MRGRRFGVLALLAAMALPAGAQVGSDSTAGDSAVVLDDFSTLTGWETAPSDGVTLVAKLGDGARGKGLRLDVDFHGGGGYAVVRKRVDLDLPPNYEFTWRIRGTLPPNNLEFKLVDPSGDNVWWSNQRDFEFPRAWREVKRKKRHVSFAWGPKGGSELSHVRDIEIAITAGSGGKGTVWIDELTLRRLPAVAATPPTPVATASSALAGHEASLAADGDSATAWRGGGPARLDLDLGVVREFGGVTIQWEEGRIPFAADLQSSTDGKRWATVRRIRTNLRPSTPIPLPEHEARYLRLAVLSAVSGVREVTVHPLGWADTPNDLVKMVAAGVPRGWYPRAWKGEQSYWTVVGVQGDMREGLLSADGSIEVGKGAFSVEPFVLMNGKVHSWNDVESEPWLERGSLPMPGVTWRTNSFILRIATFASGRAGSSRLHATYRLTSLADSTTKVTLALAIRPLQVNPPWQFLQVTGGFAPVHSVDVSEAVARVNDGRVVAAIPAPVRAMAFAFDAGEVADVVAHGVPTGATQARDAEGMASAVMAWDATLRTGESREVAIEVPLYEQPRRAYTRAARTPAALERLHAGAVSHWDSTLSRATVALPDTQNGRAITESIRASLGWILINRDSARVQPGSRSYERSWIRDGALTSAAMLRLGQAPAVRDFITWYARFQYPNGKVPCCVDDRGADPVPEHDSQGEFIFLVAEYFRHTGDRAFAERLWPDVRRAVTYQDSLRRQRLTEVYQQPDSLHLYGILPPSISHEGYSAKAMHSYWDDFFALRGFADAAMLASALGKEEAERFAALRDEFRRDLVASIGRAMEKHRIDYIPGAADLGDYDPTSTTIALAPVDEWHALPRDAVEATFERYWRESEARREGRREWENYTPYELRTVGALLRLGHPDRALAMLDYFLGDQRPPEWRGWAEVVWRDPKTPRFIGDMPHTWVASDFVRSALDLLAYERSVDSALVVGAGVRRGWLSGDGVRVDRLRTHYGALELRMTEGFDGMEVRWSLERLPPGGIVLRPPVGERFTSVREVDGGGELAVERDGGVHLLAASGRLAARLAPAGRR